MQGDEKYHILSLESVTFFHPGLVTFWLEFSLTVTYTKSGQQQKRKRTSLTETRENPQSQKLRIDFIEMEKPQTTYHCGHVPYTKYPCCYNERENRAVKGAGAASYKAENQ